MNRSEGLDLMANLLEPGWAQGNFMFTGWNGAIDDPDSWQPNFRGHPCCIEGAEKRVQTILFRTPYSAARFLPAPPTGFEGWSQWNDAESRTQQQVVGYLRNQAAVERVMEAGAA